MKFSKTAVWGFDHALRGMRNPKDSHHLSDSGYLPEKRLSVENGVEWVPFRIGEKDMDLAQRLIKSGGEHRKFLRMIHVSVDVDMPRYWHSERRISSSAPESIGTTVSPRLCREKR